MGDTIGSDNIYINTHTHMNPKPKWEILLVPITYMLTLTIGSDNIYVNIYIHETLNQNEEILLVPITYILRDLLNTIIVKKKGITPVLPSAVAMTSSPVLCIEILKRQRPS